MKLKCFICDTPARAFLKCTVGHKGKNSCERCKVMGKSVERRTVFRNTEATERLDASFRSMHQASHHHKPSPLLNVLPFVDMIFTFVLDFMHLCCNGIMKKLLDFWMNGFLSVNNRKELGRRMEYLKSQVPFEFQRKTRTTATFAKWKATEFRFFLLYCGFLIIYFLLY